MVWNSGILRNWQIVKNTGLDFVPLMQFVIEKTASALCWKLNNGGKVDKLSANEIRFLNFITSNTRRDFVGSYQNSCYSVDFCNTNFLIKTNRK